MRYARGFTLVELMVVLAVLGLAGTAVLLAMPPSDDVLALEAERFGAGLLRARDEAILGTHTIEVTATAEGYGFTRRRFGHWDPLQRPPFGNMAWAAGVAPRLPPDRAQVGFRFDPTGATGPRTLTLVHQGRPARIDLDGSGQVKVHVAAR
jgi:general secretion pathway protein H